MTDQRLLSETGGPPDAGRCFGRRVLVAEDVVALRRYLVRALGLLGCEATGVGDSQSLVEAVREAAPDAVLLDWYLGGESSTGALALLQELAVPVIVMTGDPESLPDVHVPVMSKPLNVNDQRLRLEQLWAQA